MLRCINPTEAKLIDAAAGIHVKFRLAGVREQARLVIIGADPGGQGVSSLRRPCSWSW